MKRKLIPAAVAAMGLLFLSGFAACNNNAANNPPSGGGSPSLPDSVPSLSLEVNVPNPSGMFTEADLDAAYQTNGAKTVTLSGNTADYRGAGISVSGNVVTVSAQGTYIFTGNLDGYITVNAGKQDKVRLVFRNASVNSPDYAALYIKSADKTFLTIEGENLFISSGSFIQLDDNGVDGAIFSKDDLTVNGSGRLQIRSQGHGIVCKDDFKVTGGVLDITAAEHAIQANDSVRIKDGSFTVQAGKDGIHAENANDVSLGYIYAAGGNFNINSSGDGMDASGALYLDGGVFNVKSGGGSQSTPSLSNNSQKGLKSGGNLVLSGGETVIDSVDDAIHSDSSVQIAGGNLRITAGDAGIHADDKMFITGGDLYVNATDGGIDSNDDIYIKGGCTVIECSVNNRKGALNYGNGCAAEIIGGTFAAISSSDAAKNFTSAAQGSILWNVSLQDAGTDIVLLDGERNSLFKITSSEQYDSVLISMSGLKAGNAYILETGGISYNGTVSLEYISNGGNV